MQVLMQATRHGPTPKPEPGTSLGAYNVCTIAHCSSVWNGGQLPKRTVINRTIALACVLWLQPSPIWPCGLMGKALVLGTKGCRFESCQNKCCKPTTQRVLHVCRSCASMWPCPPPCVHASVCICLPTCVHALLCAQRCVNARVAWGKHPPWGSNPRPQG